MLKAKAGEFFANLLWGKVAIVIWLIETKIHEIRFDGIRQTAERVGIKARHQRPEAVRAQSENERPDDWHRSIKEAVSACRPASAHRERPMAAATDNHVTRGEFTGWDAMG